MREYDYWLCLAPGISAKKKRQLVEYFGSSKGVYDASHKMLLQSKILDKEHALRLADAKRDLSPESLFMDEKRGIHFIGYYDENFPEILKNINNCPFGLYYRGVLPNSFESAVAIVGSRRSTPYGRSAAGDIAAALSRMGAIIVSGMAVGIDSAAAAGALRENKPTVAVLGCGVDICYPASGKNIYNNIIESGCIISELPPGTQPLPEYFPQRNRIISGLSRATIVIEAATKSGSLITCDFALDQGRDIYALPGRITDPLNEGTNRLIEQGAGIICSVDSLVKTLTESGILPFNTGGKKKNKQEGVFFYLEKAEEVVYSCLDFTPVGIDELMERVGIGFLQLTDILESLEKRGLISRQGIRSYSKNSIMRV